MCEFTKPFYGFLKKVSILCKAKDVDTGRCWVFTFLECVTSGKPIHVMPPKTLLVHDFVKRLCSLTVTINSPTFSSNSKNPFFDVIQFLKCSGLTGFDLDWHRLIYLVCVCSGCHVLQSFTVEIGLKVFELDNFSSAKLALSYFCFIFLRIISTMTTDTLEIVIMLMMAITMIILTIVKVVSHEVTS